MIGTQIITATLLPKIGDREDFSMRAVGPGETYYTFPLSMTRTVLAIWQEDPVHAAEYLTRNILGVIGTASAPPEGGFWFDSYNSSNTLKATADKIRNFGIQAFSKGQVRNISIRLLGNELFDEKEELDKFFVNKYGYEFFRSFEDAFEDSQAIEDLSTPAKDNAHFLYRICILSGFVDHINVRSVQEGSEVLSLQALKNWLKSKLNEERANELIKTFQMIKNLRKQYPIHEHYTVSADGQRFIREEITRAKEYFNITPEFERSWLNVFTAFKLSLSEIKKALEDN